MHSDHRNLTMTATKPLSYKERRQLRLDVRRPVVALLCLLDRRLGSIVYGLGFDLLSTAQRAAPS